MPRHVGSFTLADLPVDIFEWIDGNAWEPDEFPDSEAIQEQLGRFLGGLHRTRFEGIGTVRLHEASSTQYMERMRTSAQNLLRRHWRDKDDVTRYAARELRRFTQDMVASRIVAMMPDISANQFLYGSGEIVGLVDLDSYVVGPAEWELAVTEMTLSRPDAFRRGYEEWLPLPRFGAFRDYYRFMMLLSGPDENNDLTAFLTRSVYFE